MQPLPLHICLLIGIGVCGSYLPNGPNYFGRSNGFARPWAHGDMMSSQGGKYSEVMGAGLTEGTRLGREVGAPGGNGGWPIRPYLPFSSLDQAHMPTGGLPRELSPVDRPVQLVYLVDEPSGRPGWPPESALRAPHLPSAVLPRPFFPENRPPILAGQSLARPSLHVHPHPESEYLASPSNNHTSTSKHPIVRQEPENTEVTSTRVQRGYVSPREFERLSPQLSEPELAIDHQSSTNNRDTETEHTKVYQLHSSSPVKKVEGIVSKQNKSGNKYIHSNFNNTNSSNSTRNQDEKGHLKHVMKIEMKKPVRVKLEDKKEINKNNIDKEQQDKEAEKQVKAELEGNGGKENIIQVLKTALGKKVRKRDVESDTKTPVVEEEVVTSKAFLSCSKQKNTPVTEGGPSSEETDQAVGQVTGVSESSHDVPKPTSAPPSSRQASAQPSVLTEPTSAPSTFFSTITDCFNSMWDKLSDIFS